MGVCPRRMELSEPDLEIIAEVVASVPCAGCGERIDLTGCAPFAEATCPHCGTMNPAPARFGPFLLLQPLGKGGMGAVYKARDLTLDRYVAIKVLRKEYGEDQQFLNSFLQEARAAAALNHPHVAQIYSYGQEKGQPYIVMELLEGGRLDWKMETESPLDEVFIMSMAVQVAEGLQAANEIGLVHGDIKPANILFDRKGAAKVVDFGLATFAKTHRGRPGEVWGTPYYIAPETVRSRPSDQRADIYSLGGTLFHALAGVAPFEGRTAQDVVLARLEAPAPGIRTHRPDLTPRTEAVIARMLERSVNRRYPTYASLLSDLHGADEAARRQARDLAAAAARAERAVARKPILVWGLVLAALALIVAGGGWWWRQTRPPERRIVRYTLTAGKLVPVYEDELAPGADPWEMPAAAPAPVADAPPELLAAADGLCGEDPAAALAGLAAWADGLKPNDPARAEARLLQGVAAWVDGRPRDAAAAVDDIPADAPDAVRSIAGVLAGSANPAAAEAASATWAAGPRALATLVSGLAALQAGEFAPAVRQLDAYAAAPASGWWTALQARVGPWRQAAEDWQALVQQLPDDQPGEALERVRGFLAPETAVLRPVVEHKAAALQQVVRARQVREQRAEQTARNRRDNQRVAAARKAAAPLLKEGRYPEAVAALAGAVAEMETPEGQSALDADLDRARRLAFVREFLVRQLTAAPPRQAIPALGGRIVGATLRGIRLARVDGGREIPWESVNPALLLNLLDFSIQQAELEPPARAQAALSIACYWHAQQQLPVAARYARLALRLDPSLRDPATTLLPGVELPAPE